MVVIKVSLVLGTKSLRVLRVLLKDLILAGSIADFRFWGGILSMNLIKVAEGLPDRSVPMEKEIGRWSKLRFWSRCGVLKRKLLSGVSMKQKRLF